MKTTVRWMSPMNFIAETGSGHALVMDGSEEYGGRNLGPRPMELLLAGLGGCSSFDIVLMLKKARQNITDCTAEITAERASEDPKVFTAIHVHYTVSGFGVDARRVERAITLSAEKYCSASIMLGETATITHDFEIVEVTPDTLNG